MGKTGYATFSYNFYARNTHNREVTGMEGSTGKGMSVGVCYGALRAWHCGYRTNNSGHGFESLVTTFHDHFRGLVTVGMAFLDLGGRTWQSI